MKKAFKSMNDSKPMEMMTLKKIPGTPVKNPKKLMKKKNIQPNQKIFSTSYYAGTIHQTHSKERKVFQYATSL